MNKNKHLTIAGLELKLKFCKKVNEKTIVGMNSTIIPASNVYKNFSVMDEYVVNVFAFIPTELKDISRLDRTNLAHLSLLEDHPKKLILTYEGVSGIKTSIDTNNPNGLTLCRNFYINYECEDTKETEEFNLYHIQFNYKITKKNGFSVEAVAIFDNNEDPETSRGTVTTSEDTVY